MSTIGLAYHLLEKHLRVYNRHCGNSIFHATEIVDFTNDLIEDHLSDHLPGSPQQEWLTHSHIFPEDYPMTARLIELHDHDHNIFIAKGNNDYCNHVHGTS